ncbi:MAG: serine/threonine protein kinase [Anaerolineae bacterium]|nr:serine/threonine protein kinase [Anaerolineae bacterium]
MNGVNNSVPTLANRYQLLQTLGSGGMAVVYRGRDIELERPVAVKVLRQNYSKDPAFRERFRQEARAAANLSHPNIVTVHDFGLDNGRLFIVMEYMPGTDLKTLIRENKRFLIQDALRLVIQAAAGIGYAHRAGLVHCDIKPQNMLVSPDSRLKVTDFGIARALSTIHPDEHSEVVWGSPQYFSPEQAAGMAPSPSSDVYSLGVILYELVCGELPFTSKDPNELARMHRDISPTPPRSINPAIPVALEQIILKVLSKEPASRYRTADQLGRILENFLQKYETPSPTISSTPVPSTPLQRIPPPVQQTRPVYDEIESGSTNQPISNIDWITIALGLLAMASSAGLIPFWMYVFFRVFSNPGGP